MRFAVASSTTSCIPSANAPAAIFLISSGLVLIFLREAATAARDIVFTAAFVAPPKYASPGTMFVTVDAIP